MPVTDSSRASDADQAFLVTCGSGCDVIATCIDDVLAPTVTQRPSVHYTCCITSDLSMVCEMGADAAGGPAQLMHGTKEDKASVREVCALC